jgi:hypothetical protein
VGSCQQLQPGTPGERLRGCGRSATCLFSVHPGSFQHHFHLLIHRGGFRCSRVALWDAVGSCSPAHLVSALPGVGNLLRACSLCILAACNMPLLCQFHGGLHGCRVCFCHAFGARSLADVLSGLAVVGGQYCSRLLCILAAVDMLLTEQTTAAGFCCYRVKPLNAAGAGGTAYPAAGMGGALLRATRSEVWPVSRPADVASCSHMLKLPHQASVPRKLFTWLAGSSNLMSRLLHAL